MSNPYKKMPAQSFWRTGVANVHFNDLQDLWQPLHLTKADKIATAGSCFAQHIGNNLALRGANYLDFEPAPPVFETLDEARRFGYGVFSCRYGNIYTSRQLLQLFKEAFGHRQPQDIVWQQGERYFDALRPGVDPVGQSSAENVLALRKLHLLRVREMFSTLDVLVFTLGLTEGWESTVDGTMYPTAPGTVAGQYDAEKFRFRNLRYGEILSDLTEFRELLKTVNPTARLLLTVSPVPLTATATDNHVLVATTYSKSVLRAVAGDMAEDFEDVSYFPSYEIISTHPARGMFFNPDLRTVNPSGVNYVMQHFFAGKLAKEFSNKIAPVKELDLMCEESVLEESNNN